MALSSFSAPGPKSRLTEGGPRMRMHGRISHLGYRCREGFVGWYRQRTGGGRDRRLEDAAGLWVRLGFRV